MSSKAKASGKTGRSAIADVVSREYTIHMHKRVRSLGFQDESVAPATRKNQEQARVRQGDGRSLFALKENYHTIHVHSEQRGINAVGLTLGNPSYMAYPSGSGPRRP